MASAATDRTDRTAAVLARFPSASKPAIGLSCGGPPGYHRPKGYLELKKGFYQKNHSGLGQKGLDKLAHSVETVAGHGSQLSYSFMKYYNDHRIGYGTVSHRSNVMESGGPGTDTVVNQKLKEAFEGTGAGAMSFAIVGAKAIHELQHSLRTDVSHGAYGEGIGYAAEIFLLRKNGEIPASGELFDNAVRKGSGFMGYGDDGLFIGNVAFAREYAVLAELDAATRGERTVFGDSLTRAEAGRLLDEMMARPNGAWSGELREARSRVFSNLPAIEAAHPLVAEALAAAATGKDVAAGNDTQARRKNAEHEFSRERAEGQR